MHFRARSEFLGGRSEFLCFLSDFLPPLSVNGLNFQFMCVLTNKERWITMDPYITFWGAGGGGCGKRCSWAEGVGWGGP